MNDAYDVHQRLHTSQRYDSVSCICHQKLAVSSVGTYSNSGISNTCRSSMHKSRNVHVHFMKIENYKKSSSSTVMKVASGKIRGRQVFLNIYAVHRTSAPPLTKPAIYEPCSLPPGLPMHFFSSPIPHLASLDILHICNHIYQLLCGVLWLEERITRHTFPKSFAQVRFN